LYLFLDITKNTMGRRVPITLEKEEEIIAALATTPHASWVARELGVSFATVWRRAERAGIELTAGRAAKGYKRLPAEQYAKIIAVRQENPQATQQEVARKAGVSRPTVSRVTRGHNRRAGVSPVV
jgi:DNA invertase Pin-like site-specific DNA recombinase